MELGMIQKGVVVVISLNHNETLEATVMICQRNPTTEAREKLTAQ